MITEIVLALFLTCCICAAFVFTPNTRPIAPKPNLKTNPKQVLKVSWGSLPKAKSLLKETSKNLPKKMSASDDGVIFIPSSGLPNLNRPTPVPNKFLPPIKPTEAKPPRTTPSPPQLKYRSILGDGESGLDQSLASPSIREALINRLAKRRVIPWIGAGVTWSIYGGWEGVVKLLWEEAGKLGEYDKARNSEDLTVLAQFGAAKLKQQGKNMWSCIERKFIDMEKTALSKTESSHRSVMQRVLAELQPLVCGPWPAVLTTNWDTMLEQAYASPAFSKSNRAAKREGTHLPVRFREDVHLFYAELKSLRRPPMLLKLHGDFTSRGKKELVLSHADYRAIMVKDTSLNELLRQLSSEYSFFFIGTSLRDRDLLGILDEVSEGLGGGIGPHFWLTPDEVAPTRVQHLQINYNIHTINFDASLPFPKRVELLQKTLKEIAALGWIAPVPQLNYILPSNMNETPTPGLPQRSSNILNGHNFSPFKKIIVPLEDFGRLILRNEFMDPLEIRGHVASSVGLTHMGQDRYSLTEVYGTQTLVTLLRYATKKLSELDRLTGKLGEDVPKFGGCKAFDMINDRFKLWLVAGQEASGAGSPGNVFKAAKSFLKGGFKDYADAVITKGDDKILVFNFPLLASAGGQMTSKTSLSAILSAVGYFLGKYFTKLPPDVKRMDINVFIAQRNENNPDNVLSDISEGRLKPHGIVASACKGLMQFKVIHVQEFEKKFHMHTVYVKINARLGDLLEELGIVLSSAWAVEVRIGSGRFARVLEVVPEFINVKLVDIGIGEESLVKVTMRLVEEEEENETDEKSE